MNKALRTIFGGLFVACTLYAIHFFYLKNVGENTDNAVRNLIIQALPNSSQFQEVMERTACVANAIIKDELGLDAASDISFYSPKLRQRLTLYYLNDVRDDGVSLVTRAFDIMHGIFDTLASGNVMLGADVQFFAGPFGIYDELVISICDVDGALAEGNKRIKEIMHTIDTQYRDGSGNGMYDIAQSERYPYVPHIGLGRIRSTSIKQYCKSPNEFDELFVRIQNRILAAVHDIIKAILVSKDQRKLHINTFGILDLKERDYIKEYHL